MDVTNNLPFNQLFIPPQTSTANFSNNNPDVGFQIPRGNWVTDEGLDVPAAARFRRQGQELRNRARTQTTTARNNGEIGPRENIIPTVVYYDAVGRDTFDASFSGRDFSAGGAANRQEYRDNLRAFTQALGNTPIEVVVEPDALAGAAFAQGRIRGQGDNVTLVNQDEIDRLMEVAKSIPNKTGAQLVKEEAVRTRDVRDSLIDSVRFAVEAFSDNPNATIYVDAGNNRFTPTNDPRRFNFLIDNLIDLGIAENKIAGIATNTSVFEPFGEEEEYGNQIREKVQELAPGTADNKVRQIIDTSRNGVFVDLSGEDAPVFNRAEASFGRLPGDIEGNNLVSARWVKNPAESDGDSVPNGRNIAAPLNGVLGDDYVYPDAGTFNEAFLLQLYINAPATKADIDEDDTRRGFVPATKEELKPLIPEEFRDNVIPAPGSEETAAAFTPRAPRGDEPDPPETIIITDEELLSQINA